VLGLRYFDCRQCGTVVADVREPPRCSDCGADRLVELPPGEQARAYFAPSRGK
jgi:predicted Zn-ribbon and HTH transcriptional regulator